MAASQCPCYTSVMKTMPTPYHALAAMMALSATVLIAQDATKSAPAAYRTQFENTFVRLVRVHYGPNEKVPEHEHPVSVTAYIYLNASGPVQFRHIKGSTRVNTRQPTVPGSFRVSRGGDETHEVVNMTAAPSDFLRVEFKSDPAGESSPFFREAQKSYPAGENVVDVKFANQQMRLTRLAVAPGKTLELSTAAREPSLIVALKDSTLSGFRSGDAVAIAAGQERWMDASAQARLVNTGTAPAELLRIDFRTAPVK
jgi:hypothetical protein